MKLLKSLFGKKLDGESLAQSSKREEYAQIELLTLFKEGATVHGRLAQQRWSRVLPCSYEEMLQRYQQEGWLSSAPGPDGAVEYKVTDTAQPFVRSYMDRIAKSREAIMPKVRAALEERDTSKALELRRLYEAQFPLGEAGWTGPEPQLSHSALTRRILFLDHWLLDGYSAQTSEWLRLSAAEQHLWGVRWPVSAHTIPDHVLVELSQEAMSGEESVYWKIYQLALYVDNQETWQRCKGGDHVRRIRIVTHEEGVGCHSCLEFANREYLVGRVPDLPHRDCTALRGCLCRYEPVLETYEAARAKSG